MWKRFLLGLGLAFTMLLPAFAVPVLAQADQACTCFCATVSGAKKISETKISSDQCEDKCEANGDTLAVCAKTFRQYPANNVLCFDSETCAKQEGVMAKYQAKECPAGWTYCFPKAEKSELKLSVAIGDMKTVGDLGVFIQGVYKYLLGAALLFSVIMVMIGGLQYALGAGMQEQIAKGKERIKNGVIGLVLLLCAILILQIVNPQLLKLEVPRPSKLREVDLATTSCETKIAQGYQVKAAEGSKEECGGMGEITSGPGGKEVADGLTCDYTKCGAGKCVSFGPGSTAVCAQCHEVSNNNPSSPAKPSKPLCDSMTQVHYKVVSSFLDPEKKKTVVAGAAYCEFQPGGAINLYNSKQTTTAVALSADTCFEVSVDCSTINECENYDNVPVYYWDGGKLKKADLDSILPITFQQICISDPCEAGLKEKSKCTWSQVTDCD